MGAALLEIGDVAVRFGGVQALDGVSLAIAPGEMVGLIGPNGAGKTTLLRVILGLVRPDRGGVALSGRDLTALATAARVRHGLVATHQVVRPFHAMTPLDNIALAAGHALTRTPWTALLHVARARERARARELLELVDLVDAAEASTRSLPLGALKRLEVARALALDPKLLLLDEPLAGLNSNEARRLADTIVRLADEGVAVVLIEHNLGEVLRISRRLVVLDNGRIIADGDPRAVMAEAAVRAAYRGREGDDDAAA